jgi:phosphate transport system substrate-binding protein
MHPAVRTLAVLSLLAATAAHSQEIRIGGSTTSLPVISSCSAHFMEKYPTWDKADASLEKSPTVIYVTGGGSGFGVKGIMNGTIEIGMVARDLKESEVKDLNGPTIKAFARDAVAIATSTKNPAAKLKQDFNSKELADIFSGKVEKWSGVDKRLPAKSIVLLTRDAGGGVTEIFQHRVLKEERLSASRLQFPSTAGLVKKLEGNESAIAFLSAGAISKDSKVKTYGVDGVQPTQENMVSGAYSLSRPLVLVAKASPSRQVQLFLDYVLGECQATVKELGFVPVNPVAAK